MGGGGEECGSGRWLELKIENGGTGQTTYNVVNLGKGTNTTTDARRVQINMGQNNS